ncbi:hypothetical protein GE300_15835 [Rhodobacteraceae bacterium 2CG4]|uniref:DUF2029 domain-containing protein n=1 Tax=Halovulum marinum TaxID=2662447 RepID=A0A6L5Z4N4_9RHOB|nr:hypothetical protein [Halovulum marinum]MSU91060.1 hypothetical protein [Halovulum marinum]
MTQTAAPADTAPRAAPLALTAAGVALGLFAYMQALAWMRAGLFEYPLDDVYIHLAIAEQIARGNYGVNAGEVTSAASSVLYPLLLPFPEAGVQRYLPLAWNTAAVAASGALWGLLLRESGYGAGAFRRTGILLAVLGPVGLNIAGAGFTGMEHALHGAATLALLLGLLRFLRDGRIGALLVAGVLLGPLLRYEGLGPSLLVVALVLWRGRPLAGLALLALAALPLAGFTAFLLSQGLAPLPNSVLAKLGDGAQDLSMAARLAGRLAGNLAEPAGVALALLTLAAAAVALAARRDPVAGALALAGAAAGAGHLLFGKIGWMDRYEHYALLFVGGALAAALVRLPEDAARRGLSGALALALAGLTLLYQQNFGARGQWAPQAHHLQTAQMARFAKQVHAAPVAVNDLGRVAWRNPDYVLDLWGLASPLALERRLTDPRPGWADDLAAARGVTLAMVYDDWVGPAIGADWVRLGALTLDAPAGQLGGREVTFWATDPAAAPALRAGLRDFVPTLPPGAGFTFAAEPAGPRASDGG